MRRFAACVLGALLFLAPFSQPALASGADSPAVSSPESSEGIQRGMELTAEIKAELKKELEGSPHRDRVLLGLAMVGILRDSVSVLEYARSLGLDLNTEVPNSILGTQYERASLPRLAAVCVSEKCIAYLTSLGYRCSLACTDQFIKIHDMQALIKKECDVAGDEEQAWMDAEKTHQDEQQAQQQALDEQKANWLALQKAVIARDYRKARALFAKADEDKAAAEAGDGEVAISSDLLSKRGKMVYLVVGFVSNAPGGILADRGEGDRVFITGLAPGSLVSGEPIKVMAFITGTYTYRTVIGSNNTVPAVRAAVKL